MLLLKNLMSMMNEDEDEGGGTRRNKTLKTLTSMSEINKPTSLNVNKLY